jgi:hypothetical protein
MNGQYPWELAGPWYRLESVGGGPGRAGRPIIQKYASTDFVNAFLTEPQASLKFVCEDFVNRICIDNIYEPVTPQNRQQGDQLKLFLDSHSRHYLVVCELHCRGPGYPSVTRSQVCETGFVVRRYRSRLTAGRDELYRLVRQKNTVMAKVRKLVSGAAKKPLKDAASIPQIIQMAGDRARSHKMEKLKTEYQQVNAKLQNAIEAYDVIEVLQKWIPNENLKGVGSWVTIETDAEATPQVIDEEIHPLYPLIPDPAQKQHSAEGKTMWFGVVPTFGADVGENGYAKFDNESAYEIRCYVRRHIPGCPLTAARNDCRGEIVWSEATESFKLASYFDLDGTGHKPINIQLPDLDALKDQAIRGPAGKGLNVRMVPPPNSALNFVSKGMSMPDKGSRGNQICFNCVFLITIVALFVLQLFLPIVVFLFGLWFMLRLKLCIPPSFSFDAQLAADLKAYGPSFEAEISAEISANLSVIIGGKIYTDIEDLKNDIKAELQADPAIPDFMKADFKAQVDAEFDETLGLIVDMATDFSDQPDPLELAGKIPVPEDGLIYFEKVTL